MELTINMNSSRLIRVVFLVLIFAIRGFGQHQGHQMPQPKASPTPAATPGPSPSGAQTHRHTPGMPLPAASPSPTQEMNMPVPGASPSPNAMGQMEGMHTMGAMDMGPLVVMNGDDMGIRIGSGETNLISMGAMGSGTS